MEEGRSLAGRLGEHKTKRASIPSADGFTLTDYCLDFSRFRVLLPATKTLPRIRDGNLSFAGQALSFRGTIRR